MKNYTLTQKKYICDMEHYTIKYGNNVFEASEYQDKIFNNVVKGSGNMVISAAAGASKTTTIINCIDLVNKKERLMFVAFNKDIVENIQEKIGERENVYVTTFHSLGYSILKENGIIKSDEQINEFKYRNYIKNNINFISSYHETSSLKKDYNSYIKNIISLVEYCRYYTAFSLKEIKRIADKYGITVIRDEYEVAKEVLKWGKDNTEYIDFTDMIWLPNALNLITKKNRYDWILIDEAQDTSITEQMIIEKCFKRGTRFIAVGDEAQQINVWAGASEEAMNILKNHPNTEIYNLPISYRCPKKIVNLAKKYSDNIIAKDDAIEGKIRYDVSPNDPQPGDMVLCRTTAPLIELHLKYIRLNKKSFVRGFENIKKQYISLIESCNSVKIDRNCLTYDGLFPQMYSILLREIEKVKETYNLDEEDSLTHINVLRIYDNIEGIKVMSEGLTTVKELIDKINIVFEGDDENAISLSTVHKAKGLESDNVYILCPSLMPSSIAKKEWEKKTEENLIYVAITRAKKTLNFIEEPRHGKMFYGAFNSKKLKDDVEYYSNKLKFNKENYVSENRIICKIETPSAKTLGGQNEVNLKDKKSKKKAGGKLMMLLNQ